MYTLISTRICHVTRARERPTPSHTSVDGRSLVSLGVFHYRPRHAFVTTRSGPPVISREPVGPLVTVNLQPGVAFFLLTVPPSGYRSVAAACSPIGIGVFHRCARPLRPVARLGVLFARVPCSTARHCLPLTLTP